MSSDSEAPQGATKLIRVSQIGVMLAATVLLVVHVIKWEAAQVVGIALGLLALILIVPLSEFIKKLKFGELEAEIGRGEVAQAQAKAAVELAGPLAERKPKERVDVYDLVARDPQVALAKVRIDLEAALKDLYGAVVQSNIDMRRTSMSRLIDELARREVISRPMAGALRDVIALANRAIHGERVEPGAAEDLVDLAVGLIRELRDLFARKVWSPAEEVEISTADAEGFASAKYRVTTVVPLVDNPALNSYIFDQEELTSFLEGYEEVAEFLVGIERLP